ncbi:MAG: leucine-rich repeat domain-containing protein [Dehalococcoidia bacterium]|jgi:hypothetical protein
MTTLVKALHNIRAEIAQEICGITVNRGVDADNTRFREHSEKDKKPFTEINKKPRLFRVGDPVRADDWRNEYNGGELHEQTWRIPLTVAYPRGNDWHIVATDDFDVLRRQFLSTYGTHGVDGVNFRILEDVAPTIEQHPEVNWDYFTTPVIVGTETTWTDTPFTASFTWAGTGAKLLQLGGETGRTVSVDWGDGADADIYTLSSVSVINCTHTYSTGPHTVVLSGWVDKITTLILDSQIVTNIDGLTHLTGLVTFYMYDNSVADISVLDRLINLELLDIGINNFTDISSLSGLTKLRELYLGPNTIDDISHLSTLVNLEVLFVIQCGVASLSFASGMSYLTDLDASYNSIASISVLSSLPLVNVDISHNLITDVSPLKDIPTLEVCVFNSNALTYVTTDWPTYDGVTLTGYSTSLAPTEVDLFLNDLYSDVVVNSAINLEGTNGTRTAASDTAVTWLRANGNTITVHE